MAYEIPSKGADCKIQIEAKANNPITLSVTDKLVMYSYQVSCMKLTDQVGMYVVLD